MSMRIRVTNELTLNMLAREWCKLPYPGHPRGCPNFGKSAECPPKVSIIHDAFDLHLPHWFIVEEYDLQEHAEVMGNIHPEWSERQRRNCLYWQGGVRKRLRESCVRMIDGGDGDKFTLIPEAMGVDVIDTAQRLGIAITRAAFPIVYKIALVGYKPKEGG